MSETALFVDDEEYVLNAVERLFMESDIRLLRASNGMEALEFVKEEEIAVLISDNMMPGLSGIDLLSKVKELSPDTIKILMTAHADLTTAVDAINKSEVFRFIIKPWKNDQLMQTVEDAVNRYRIIKSLRKADESTLLSLAQTIELKDPYTRGHCDRVAKYALKIAGLLQLNDVDKREIKHGSWLHDCGKIGIPEEILNSKGALNKEQYEMIKNHPTWGAEVARQAQLPARTVNTILYHHEKYDGTGYPSGTKGDAIPLEARIVSVVDVFDALTTDRPYGKRFTFDEALKLIVELKESSFDPGIVDAFVDVIPELKAEDNVLVSKE